MGSIRRGNWKSQGAGREQICNQKLVAGNAYEKHDSIPTKQRLALAGTELSSMGIKRGYRWETNMEFSALKGGESDKQHELRHQAIAPFQRFAFALLVGRRFPKGGQKGMRPAAKDMLRTLLQSPWERTWPGGILGCLGNFCKRLGGV